MFHVHDPSSTRSHTAAETSRSLLPVPVDDDPRIAYFFCSSFLVVAGGGGGRNISSLFQDMCMSAGIAQPKMAAK